jgi:ubiquinone/menaquinone biosynthesis C-methylase UbiE
MNRLIRFAFDQFYTTFAWTYDAVAHAVSFGEWRLWGESAIPFLQRAGRGRVLEIAHGPGHLHQTLQQQGFSTVGIDLSMQMCRMLQRRFIRESRHLPNQARASALQLPFVDRAFTGAVSTFPAGFIFEQRTLREVHRVLATGGRFVIVPGTRFRGNGLGVNALKFAYAITGQGEAPTDAVRARFESVGFAFEAHTVQTLHADVTVWVCSK